MQSAEISANLTQACPVTVATIKNGGSPYKYLYERSLFFIQGQAFAIPRTSTGRKPCARHHLRRQQEVEATHLLRQHLPASLANW